MRRWLHDADWRSAGLALLGLLAVAAALYPVYIFCESMREGGALTADWPWLYATGLHLISTWTLPRSDIYSWTFPEHPWLLYQWLFEAVAAPLYRLLGLNTSVIVFSLLSIGIYAGAPALLLRRRGVPLTLSLIVGALVLVPVSANLSLRPMLASIIALLLQFAVVHRWRRIQHGLPALLMTIAAIYVVWANMHLGVVLGLSSLVLFAIGDLIERPRALTRGQLTKCYGAMLAVAFLASLINPYGFRIYEYIWTLSLKQQMNSHIHELMPPNIANPLFMTGAGLVAVFVVALLACAVLRRRPGVSTSDVLHVLVASAMTMTALRFVVWACLFYALVAPVVFWSLCRPWLQRARMTAWARIDVALAMFFILGSVAVAAGVAPARTVAWIDGCPQVQQAVIYLDRHFPANTRWFSSEFVGSCTRMIAPHRRTFIDTRFDMFPPAFVLGWLAAYQDQPHWRAFIDHWRIQLLLIPRGGALMDSLQHDPGFRSIYNDRGAVIFARSGAVAGSEKARRLAPAHTADAAR